MKKVLFVIISAFLLGACAQKTCPTYAQNDLGELKANDVVEGKI